MADNYHTVSRRVVTRLSIPNVLDFLITPDSEAEKKRMADNYHTGSRRVVTRLSIPNALGFLITPDSEAEKTVWQITAIRFRGGSSPACLSRTL